MAASPQSSEAMILDLLRARRLLRIDQVVDLVPQLTWNQVFTTVDALSRRGDIVLLRRGFDYEVAWSPTRTPPMSCSV
jgi:hypothetical protein